MTSSESEEWRERWEQEGSPDPWRPRKPAGFSPPGMDGLLGYEITCAERRLLNWRCEHEPPNDEWFNDWERRYQSSALDMEELPKLLDDYQSALDALDEVKATFADQCLFG